jgi:hypothetical protein
LRNLAIQTRTIPRNTNSRTTFHIPVRTWEHYHYDCQTIDWVTC